MAGRHTVDFEGLSFAQGGHLNTNKNTNLPPGSTRTTDKVISRCPDDCRIQPCDALHYFHKPSFKATGLGRGISIMVCSLAKALEFLCRVAKESACSAQGFEEIHVPALRQKPYASDEKDRAIADLPDWMQPAFKGMKSLNRIQSKVRRPPKHLIATQIG